jgi:hypothetical protein
MEQFSDELVNYEHIFFLLFVECWKGLFCLSFESC